RLSHVDAQRKLVDAQARLADHLGVQRRRDGARAGGDELAPRLVEFDLHLRLRLQLADDGQAQARQVHDLLEGEREVAVDVQAGNDGPRVDRAAVARHDLPYVFVDQLAQRLVVVFP